MIDRTRDQVFFHFQTQILFRAHLKDSKNRFNKQIVFLSCNGGNLEFKKRNGKKFLSERDINSINIKIEKEKDPWSEEDFYTFCSYENNLAEIEGYFWTNFFEEHFLIKNKFSVNNNVKLGGIQLDSDPDRVKISEKINNELGEIKNLTLQEYILFLEYQSIISEYWIETEITFIELIKKLSDILSLSSFEPLEDKDKLMINNLKKVKRYKFVDYLSIMSKKGSKAMPYLISTRITSNILEDGVFISIIKVNNDRLDIFYWNETGKINKLFSEWMNYFTVGINREEGKLDLFLLAHINIIPGMRRAKDKKEVSIPNFYVPYNIWDKYDSFLKKLENEDTVNDEEYLEHYTTQSLIELSLYLKGEKHSLSKIREEYERINNTLKEL